MKKRFITTLAVLSIAFLVFTIFSMNPKDGDVEEYRNIMQKSQAKSHQGLKREPFVATQHRIGVRKDIFYEESGQRLQMRVDSDKSNLVYHHLGDKTEIVEELVNLRCYMQEELYYTLPDKREVIATKEGRYRLRNGSSNNESSWIEVQQKTLQPMQKVRYIEAEKADFKMTADSLVANQAEVYQYKIPGHSLDEWDPEIGPLMKGIADKIEVNIKNSGVDLKASGLKGKVLFPIGGRVD